MRKLTENQIQSLIHQYLTGLRIFSWINPSIGVYDKKRETYRSISGTLKGVSDILGIYQGKPLAIEVKTESEHKYIEKNYARLKEGSFRSDQKKFLHLQRQINFIDNFQEAGGIAFFCSSLKGLKEELSKVEGNT